jgi:hypothetical protein
MQFTLLVVNILRYLLVAMEGFYSIFIIFTEATFPTKDAKMVAISKLLKGRTNLGY